MITIIYNSVSTIISLWNVGLTEHTLQQLVQLVIRQSIKYDGSKYSDAMFVLYIYHILYIYVHV